MASSQRLAAKLSNAEYLKKYVGGVTPSNVINLADPTQPKRLKKKKKKPVEGGVKTIQPKGLKILDEDEAHSVKNVQQLFEDEEEDFKPIIITPKEDPMAAATKRQYIKIEDGSGWVTVADPTTVKAEPQGDSPPRGRAVDEDSSPPRNRATEDQSPPRRRVDEDQSPPRRVSIKGEPTGDSSPPRRRAEVDSSPPRRRPGADSSPPRRRQAAGADSSPPRRRATEDLSPPRRGGRDSSPPRRGRDSSPPRRGRDSSPPRRGGRDSSPPRKRVSEDLSPPRNRAAGEDLSPPRKRSRDLSPPRTAEGRDVPPPSRMSSGALAGLHDASSVKKQADEIAKQKQAMFSKVDASALGKDAATVFRDKRGRRLEGLEEFQRQQKGKFTADEEDNMVWGKGKVQHEQKEDLQQQLEEMKNAPFARTKDDEAMNDMLKDQDRWGDPMLGLIKKQPKKSSKKSTPIYNGPPGPPNRFGIRPGFRWDGVDRGNGFETQLFALQAKRVAVKDEAYLWSVEDM